MNNDLNMSVELDLLLPALVRLGMLQREAVDRLALQEAVAASGAKDTPQHRLAKVSDHLQINAARWRDGRGPRQ